MSADERTRERTGTEEEAPTDRTDDSLIPYSWPGWGVWSPMAPWRSDDRDGQTIEDEYVEGREPERREGGEESLWEEGLYTTLIVVGAALILFPEPATSGIGVVLAFVGAVGWLYEALT